MVIRWKKLGLIEPIEQEVTTWAGVSADAHERGGRQFDLNGKEIGHIHWNGDLDILFNKKIRDELLRQGRVEEHKWVPDSGWTTFPVDNEEDIPKAIELLKLSYPQKKKRLERVNINEELASLDFTEDILELI